MITNIWHDSYSTCLPPWSFVFFFSGFTRVGNPNDVVVHKNGHWWLWWAIRKSNTNLDSVVSIGKFEVGVNVSWYWKRKAAIRPYGGGNDVLPWKQFQHYWPFMRGINSWPNPLMGNLMFCSPNMLWIKASDAGDLGHHDSHMTTL